MTTTAIGFANKFYTLWHISEDTKPLGNGRSYVVTHYTYIKNISFDKEIALSKYPEAIFDESLRGKTQSWNTEKEVWDNVDTFRFGKYQYTKIADNNDNNYIAWYWDQIGGDHKDFVSEVLKSRGYEIRHWNSDSTGYIHYYLVSPEALKAERERNENISAKIVELEKGEPISIRMEYNPDSEGYYRDDFMLYHFEEVRENYYNGYDYYLPVLNGKQKRIKNKNLVITKYTYEVDNNDLIINILDFKIEK